MALWSLRRRAAQKGNDVCDLPGLQGITETGGHEGDISEGANLGAFAQHGALGSAGQTQADAGGRIRGHDSEKVFTALGFSNEVS